MHIRSHFVHENTDMKTYQWIHLFVFGICSMTGMMTIVTMRMFDTDKPSGMFVISVEIVMILCISISLGFWAAWLFRKKVTVPLKNIASVAGAVHGGAAFVSPLQENVSVPNEVRRAAEAVAILADKALKDVAETKRLERVRSEFLGNVSHELRTPIFSIQGYLETLLDGALDDPNVARQFTQRAYSNAERLNILLGDLINISKIESGEMRLSFRYFYINEIIKDTVQALEFEAEQRQVKMYCDIESSAMATVFGDKERVLQVITNLVQNAIKYNVDGGEVNISTIVREKEVVIKVSDSGIGIPKEHLPRIFERFYRVDKDRSRAVGGTGLGLAIVKHILEAHQSQFSAESDIGKGTTISFTLKR